MHQRRPRPGEGNHGPVAALTAGVGWLLSCALGSTLSPRPWPHPDIPPSGMLLAGSLPAGRGRAVPGTPAILQPTRVASRSERYPRLSSADICATRGPTEPPLSPLPALSALIFSGRTQRCRPNGRGNCKQIISFDVFPQLPTLFHKKATSFCQKPLGGT